MKKSNMRKDKTISQSEIIYINMRRLTHKQFVDNINKDIKVVGKYINGRSKINVMCRKCLYNWNPVAASLIAGHGCPECGKQIAKSTIKWKISQKSFIKKIPFKIAKKIKILDQYKSYYGRINVLCKVCKSIWETSPSNLYSGHSCKKCGHKKTGLSCRMTHDKYIEKIEDCHNGCIRILGKYNKGTEKIKAQCMQCDSIWEKPAQYLLKRGCSQCRSSKV